MDYREPGMPAHPEWEYIRVCDRIKLIVDVLNARGREGWKVVAYRDYLSDDAWWAEALMERMVY